MSKSKIARRSCTAALASALVIALSSCSGATNTYGALDSLKDTVYAQAGDYSVTYGELWDQLQWNSKDVLEDQITNVVLQKQFNKIYNVMNNDFSSITKDQLSDVGIDKDADGAEEKFNNLKKEYSERLVDYVIQDVFNLTFDIEGYDDEYKQLTYTNRRLYENKYIDNIYIDYHVEKIGNEDLADLVLFDDESQSQPLKSNFDNYLKIANDETLRSIYYVDFAKELLAAEKLTEEVNEANEDDEDEDDDRWGYFITSDFVSEFKELYINLNKINAILVRFASKEEFDQTIRAFGIKFYKDRYYYIDDEHTKTYEEYIEYYDEFPNTKLNAANKVQAIDDDVMIEVFVQIFNYYYGGYRTPIETGNMTSINVKDYYELDKLRYLTDKIIQVYASDSEGKYAQAKENLIANYSDTNDDTFTLYTAETLKSDYSSLNFYLHNTLDSDTPSKRYSSAPQSTSNGYYIAYKFADQQLDADDVENYEEVQKHSDFYNEDLNNYEILNYIQKNNLRDEIEKSLITSRLTESKIKEYIDAEIEDVKVKIYNEPTEIAYLAAHSTYSKTLASSDDKNLLASLTYDDVTYNIQIYANNDAINNDTDTEKTLTYVGNPNKAFGVFNYLENKEGTTTAIDLISNKIIKNTNAYKEKDKDREEYLEYIENLLYRFSNGAFETSGYPSSIGKYNFLMLYFHTAVIDEIIDNFYKVQFASVDLLTDYSNDTLINFFNSYSENLYDTYFSLSGTRLLVYFDGNDDNKADYTETINSKTGVSWEDYVITSEESAEFAGMTRGEVAKKMIYDVYTLIAASTSSHTDRLDEIVEEINNSAKVEYGSNPIVSENKWAKYLHLGLRVKTESISVSNSSTDIDFSIKQRIYDYARGTNGKTGADEKTYQYFINDSTPTCYVERLTKDSYTDANNDDIVKSNDGYNLLLITSGTAKSSAEFKEKDNDENILTDIYFKYNDKDIVIGNIYNEDDKLTTDQIKFYVLDYAINGSATLTPSSLADSYTNYLSGIVTRFTGTETQRIVLLSFIRNKTGQSSSTEFYDVVKFDNAAYNGADGVFDKYIQINQTIADDYNKIYNDTTNTSNPYESWWTDIKNIIDSLLLEDK